MSAAVTARQGITDGEKERIQNEFRVPVDSSYPSRVWIISLDEESQMPTDEELRQLRSYCEFKVKGYFNATYIRRILEEMPLPADSGHNTMTFRERGEDGGWCYRKLTWTLGPMFVPNWALDGYHPHTLVEIMDHYETLFPEKWEQWKAEHSDIFPVYI